MQTAHFCPQCQQPLAHDAPDGLCPQCLLKAATGAVPDSKLDGLPVDIIDIADPAEVGKRLPQFEIYELIGRGGMGVVYRARQQQLDRVVALKILPQVDALSPDFVARFTREARSLARLNHPNIVHVYDFGESNGLHYIIMEFVDGKNLRELFEARKLTPGEALAIVPPICNALQYAHEEGIVHRDIKPENILIDKKGNVKIADFGLAKLLRREPLDLTLTLSGTSLGTLRYMAPEQMDKPETVDHRADLYSLGVVIYEMLTGELPVGRFDLPSQKAQVDARLDQIILHALEREPARRYQHASEVRQDLEEVSNPAAAQNPAEHHNMEPAVAPQGAVARPPKRHLLQAFLTLLWFLTFMFAANFRVMSNTEEGVRTHFVTVGSFDPLFIYESRPLGFQNSINLISWSFFVAAISAFLVSAIWRIDREDGGKVPRDRAWWRAWWKQFGFWCGLLLLACIIRTALNPVGVLNAGKPTHVAGLPNSAPQSAKIQDPLFAAVAAGKVSQVRELIRQGADVNDKDPEGTPALIVATRHGHPSMVSALMLLGADVNERDAQGRTALMVAAEANDATVIKTMYDVKHGLDRVIGATRVPDPNDSFSRPAARAGGQGNGSVLPRKSIREAMAQFVPMVDDRLLDEIGPRVPEINIDADAQDGNGETALIKAAARGCIQALDALQWSRPELQDRDGRTAAMHLALRGQTVLLRWEGKKPIFGFGGARVISAECLAITDHAGKTAIQLARESGHDDIAEIFTAHLERIIDQCNRAIAEEPTGAGLRQQLTYRAWAYRALGRLDEATKDFAEAEKTPIPR